MQERWTETKSFTRCTAVYQCIKDENFESHKLDYVIPKEGYKIFKVGATYAKQLNPTTYYVLGQNKKDVRDYMKYTLLLNVVKYVELVPETEWETLCRFNNGLSVMRW